MRAETNISHEEKLALEYVRDRIHHFSRLHLPVKKLVLGIVDYYLDRYFSYHTEANQIVEGIRTQPDEMGMVDLYQQFLEFLPVRLRSGIQGRYLFQEPSMDEKKLNEQRLELKEELFEDLDEASIAAELGLDLGQIEKLKSMQPASDVSPEEQERLLDEALKFIKEEGLGRVMGE